MRFFSTTYRLQNVMVLLTALISMLALPTLAIAGPFSNHSKAAGHVERNPDRKKSEGCDYYHCGPTTVILLSPISLPLGMGSALNFGTGEIDFLDGNYRTGQNGSLKNAKEYEKTSQLGLMAYVDAYMKEAASSNEIAQIEITIPMIDYGFTGSFQNIRIEMNTTDDRNYRSVILNTQTGEHASFTGSVNIEHYSPFALKGSYSGSLNIYEAIRPMPPPGRPLIRLASSGALKGQFNILRPVNGDERIINDVQATIVDPMRNDIKQMAAQYGLDIDVDQMFDRLDANIQRRSNRRSNISGGGSGGGSAYEGCNCSCNFTQSASDKCKTVCRPVFDVCMGERYTPLQTPMDNLAPPKGSQRPIFLLKDGEKFMNIDQDVLDNYHDDTFEIPSDLRSKFIAALEKKMPGADFAVFRENVLKAFDEEPTEKGKMFMFITLGGEE